MRHKMCVRAIILCVLVLSCVVHSAAQVNTATLSGTVIDPKGYAVGGAKVTVTNAATGAVRSIVADDEGRYVFIGLVPGRYKMSVDGGANFGVFQHDSIIVTESCWNTPKLAPPSTDILYRPGTRPMKT